MKYTWEPDDVSGALVTSATSAHNNRHMTVWRPKRPRCTVADIER